MKFLQVFQTSERRFIAIVLGTKYVSRGTSVEFAVGALMKAHGHKMGVNVMPEDEVWAWALRHPSTRCAVPLD